MDIRNLINTLEDISTNNEPQIGDNIEIELGDTLLETYITDVTEDGVVIHVDESALKLLINAKRNLNEWKNVGESLDESGKKLLAKKGDVEVFMHSPDDEGSMTDVYKAGEKIASGYYDMYANSYWITGLGKGDTPFDNPKDIANYFLNKEEGLGEGLKDPKDNPCWKGYHPVGTKKKNGRTVPNCVPKESVEESIVEEDFDSSGLAEYKPTSVWKANVLLAFDDINRKMQKAPECNQDPEIKRSGAGVRFFKKDGNKYLRATHVYLDKNRRPVEPNLNQKETWFLIGKDGKSFTPVKSVAEGFGDTIKKGVKNIKRGLQGWGTGNAPTPKELVSRNKGYDDETIKSLSTDTRNVTKHSPADLQKRVVDREMKKRGLGDQGVTEGRMKDMLHDEAESLELEEFLAKHAHSPEDQKWMTEFWNNVNGQEDEMSEAKYQGREVPLGKPMAGDVKKSKVYVKGPKGNVVKVNFGDKNMRIKKSNPGRRKNFRARHNCDNPGPRWKARYWSCRAW